MSSEIVSITTAAGSLATLADLADQNRAFVTASLSKATKNAYASDWIIFTEWCGSRAVDFLPATAATVAAFLTDQTNFIGRNGKKLSAATISRRVAAIRYFHDARDLDSPTDSKLVSATLKGIRATLGTAPSKKTPATADHVATMLKHIPNTLIGKRDRALLTLGFAGAFRRSELTALTIADLEDVVAGYKVTIRKSKTDQEGQGQTIGIFNGDNLKVKEAVNDWLTAANITAGPIFRRIGKGGRLHDNAVTDQSVALIVKKYAELAGLDPADFAGHSLRSGFITSGAEAGASLIKLMEVSRHKKAETVMGYIRSEELLKDHAGKGFM